MGVYILYTPKRRIWNSTEPKFSSKNPSMKRFPKLPGKKAAACPRSCAEMIDRQLQYRQRYKMMLAAWELQADYKTDPELTEFLALDGDDFLFGEDDTCKGVRSGW